VDVLDHEVVRDEVVVRLGVGRGGLDQLADVLGRAAGGEAKQGQRVIEGQAPNLVGDQARLTRGDADEAGAGVDDRSFGGLLGLRLCLGRRRRLCLPAGFFAVAFSEALASAVLEVAFAAVPEPFVAVSFGFGVDLR
jgi:hypothetical protein